MARQTRMTNRFLADSSELKMIRRTVPVILRDIEMSNATFGRHNGSFGVCVTKPNYIPKSLVCDTTYLQNKTFTGSKLYATKHIMIGSNVTNKVAQGAVVINSGSTTVNASQDVTITKDFEVKTGAEFIIMN